MKQIRYLKSTGALLGMTTKDVGWTDDAVHGVLDVAEWPAGIGEKPMLVDAGAVREATTPEEIAAVKRGGADEAEQRTDIRFVESRRDLLVNTRGLTRTLVRVLARRLGATTQELMDEVKAEAGL